MIEVERFAVKIIGIFGIAALLCCIVRTARQAAGTSDQPQAAVDFNPSVHCPDATLSSIDSIDSANPSSIIAITEGIQGLPYDAAIEKSGTNLTDRLQHGFDYYSWLTFIVLNSPAGGKTSMLYPLRNVKSKVRP